MKQRLHWMARALAGLLMALLLATTAAAQSADKPYTNEQLDQMLAQIALYPDSLLSQVLMATTYPDEFAAAMAWSKAHPDAKGDDAVKMVENEPWEPSVASLVAFPEVLITLGERPDYVKNLGDAFLAQPDAVMDAVQRLRAAAQKAGNLKSNEQIAVSSEAAPPPAATTTAAPAAAPAPQVIVIQPAAPTVVYVPAYNPTVVYGPWWYPAYPPYYYPPPPGYWWSRTIATGIAWGVAIGVNNALWGGFNWGRHDVDINVNRYNNINVNKRIDVNSNRVSWNHNPEHRGKTPYRGGDDTRKKLDKKYDSGSREAFRGRDNDRDASRERAAQSMKDRGVSPDKGGVAEKAGARDAGKKAGGDGAARAQAQSADRDAAKSRAQAADKDNALRGAGSTQAKQAADRGAASAAASKRPGGGGDAARPSAGAAKARASDGGAAKARASDGGGAKARAGAGGDGRKR